MAQRITILLYESQKICYLTVANTLALKNFQNVPSKTASYTSGKMKLITKHKKMRSEKSDIGTE